MLLNLYPLILLTKQKIMKYLTILAFALITQVVSAQNPSSLNYISSEVPEPNKEKDELTREVKELKKQVQAIQMKLNL